MAVLIRGDPIGEVDVTKLLELENGRAVRVSDGLFEMVEKIKQLTGGHVDEAQFLSLSVNLLGRLVEVCVPDDESESVTIDEDLIDRLVIAGHVGTVSITAAEEVSRIAMKVRGLDKQEGDVEKP